MIKHLIVLLLSGYFSIAVAACNSSLPIASEGLTESSSTEESEEQSDSIPIPERADYSEVPLPEGATLVGSDPQQIALDAFGNSEPIEGNFQEEVSVIEQTTDQALVTLTQTGLPDDSVQGMRYLLEFLPEDNQWRLNWAGRQMRCYPDRGSQEWTTDICS